MHICTYHVLIKLGIGVVVKLGERVDASSITVDGFVTVLLPVYIHVPSICILYIIWHLRDDDTVVWSIGMSLCIVVWVDTKLVGVDGIVPDDLTLDMQFVKGILHGHWFDW